ncbi:chromosome segregation protein Csm1/Pcs1-domain-containing protein [Lipomyces kononenkoae]|uniref:Chromosome segregation protein Csm1/Pcs1-domain-containing protein n=1 Tax=Lipomyces kononenkoae TaxID=34357 RepID=A0ACC3T8B3_LIPKO
MPRAKKATTTAQDVANKKNGVKKSTAAKTKNSVGTLSALVNSTDDEGATSNGSDQDVADVAPPANKNIRKKAVARGGKTAGNGKKRGRASTSEDVEKPCVPEPAAEMNGPKNKKARSRPLTQVTNMAGVASSTPESAIRSSVSKPRQTKPAPKSLPQKLEDIPETQNAYDNEPPSPATDMQQQKTELAIESSEAYRTLQKHYDALQTRFSRLSELRETTAEAALSSYRDSAERRYAAADELITTLRTELSERSNQIKMMSSRVEEATNADRELDELEKTVQKLRQENAVLQSKLVARVAPVAGTGSSATIAQLKEDLFSDLSGLIIRDVRVEQDKTVYDCLQTGRNGAFHYKISIPRNSNDGALPHGSATANGSGGGYEDTEITFVPMLDEKRDAFLMSLLPDYFTEPLTFMRSAAAQCYWKIAQALQKKL